MNKVNNMGIENMENIENMGLENMGDTMVGLVMGK